MTNRAVRVSVIMPFLDLERFLAESIESVRAQTYPHWELLLIDDGSTDSSSEIARGYAAGDPERIRYLTHPARVNLGASASRNLGIRHSTGEYFALLDGDDVWEPHKLEEQVPLLSSMPDVGAIYGRTLLWYSWTGKQSDRRRDQTQPLGVAPNTVIPAPGLLLRTLPGTAPVPCTCSILMRREAVEAVGGFEEDFRRVYTDQAFYAKLLLSTPVYVSDACWDRYRQHPDSSVFVAIAAGEIHPELPHPARHAFLTWFEGYLADRGMQGTEVWQVLQRQLWLYAHPRLHLGLKSAQRLPDRVKAFGWEVLLPFTFAIGRRVLPGSVREWLWDRWLRHRLS
jgi:glycosyltransferase involved in cell wall biosynthesis